MPYADPAKRNAHFRERYRNDPEFRARQATRNAARRAANPEHVREEGRRSTATYRNRHPDRVAEYKAKPESKAREAAWMKASRAANPEHHREARLRQYRADPLAGLKGRTRAHGIKVDDYARMLAEQDEVCAICRGPETARDGYGRVRRLAIDHDHATGQIRGLLCHNCNLVLGHADDNPELLETAAGYLRAALRRADLRIVEV